MSAMVSEDFRDVTEDAGAGVGIDDLPELMREMFLQCVADARSAADPFADSTRSSTSCGGRPLRRSASSAVTGSPMRPSPGQR